MAQHTGQIDEISTNARQLVTTAAGTEAQIQALSDQWRDLAPTVYIQLEGRLEQTADESH
jgi:ABC-type transporter Mla subunit MlaD